MSLSDNTTAHAGAELPFPGNRRSRRKPLLALALVAIVGGGGWWYWQQGQQQQESNAPLLATVEIGSIENTIASAGTLKPSRFVDVGAQVNGILQKLHVAVGDVVEEGQLLAEIDARLQLARVEASRASIAAQEAQVEARRAQLVLAKANADRQERLMAEDATSQLEYDNAVNNLAAADASLIQLQRQIEQSRASLRTEETQLEFTRIFAPASGTVVTVEMNEGRTLNVNQMAPTILRIAEMSQMTVEADISEADIGNIKSGMDVYFTTLGSGNRRWYSTVKQILPTPEVLNNVVLYTGLFDIDNPDGALLAEMTAQVYFITSAAENVLTVPMGAVTFLDEQDIGTRLAARRVAGQAPPAGAAPPAGFTPPPGFTPPAGGFNGGGPAARIIVAGAGPGAGAGARGQGGPRPAKVTVMNADGTQTEREVMIGVTSRVSAEVISGLQAGEQVVAGIVQSETQAPAQNQGGPNIRIGGGGFGGGFR